MLHSSLDSCYIVDYFNSCADNETKNRQQSVREGFPWHWCRRLQAARKVSNVTFIYYLWTFLDI